MTALHALQFGPFSTAYHEQLVTDAFKESARRFVATRILPQVDHDIIEIDGTLTPRATVDENCGPNSAVKNCFELDIRFFGQNAADYSELKADLWYRPDSGTFQVATRSSLYVWTPTRLEERISQKAAIHRVVDSVLQHEVSTAFCPVCFANVSLINTPDYFHAACPNKCFRYNFHKDEKGRFLHGHFFMFQPQSDA